MSIPACWACICEQGDCLSYEVIARRLDDRGGGLARVNGQLRMLEGLAMPREEDEFRLSYYNSMTTWIDLDKLLAVFGLTRSQLERPGGWSTRRSGGSPGGFPRTARSRM